LGCDKGFILSLAFCLIPAYTQNGKKRTYARIKQLA